MYINISASEMLAKNAVNRNMNDMVHLLLSIPGGIDYNTGSKVTNH